MVRVHEGEGGKTSQNLWRQTAAVTQKAKEAVQIFSHNLRKISRTLLWVILMFGHEV